MVLVWLRFGRPPAGLLRGRPMNPADVAQSVAPLTSANLSLFHLFLHAHWIVETVMLGLLICSVWVWAIAIDKTFLFSRIRKAGEQFEQAVWSGQARMEAKPRGAREVLRRFADADREGDGRRHCPGNRAHGTPAFGAGDSR